MPNPLSTNGLLLTDTGVSVTDRLKFEIMFAKTAGTATQTINLATFAAGLATTDDRVSVAIKSLESAGAISSSYAALTLNWLTTPTTSETPAQLQANWNAKILDDPTYYVYQALAMTKTAAATQTVDPATFAAAPWNIPRDILISEIQKLAARKPSTTAPTRTAPFTADFANVTLTWLSANVP